MVNLLVGFLAIFPGLLEVGLSRPPGCSRFRASQRRSCARPSMCLGWRGPLDGAEPRPVLPLNPVERGVEIREVLERERERVYDRIASYPTPIPACDEQFNHLLELRARIASGLACIDRGAPGRELVDEIGASLELFSPDTAGALREYLGPIQP